MKKNLLLSLTVFLFLCQQYLKATHAEEAENLMRPTLSVAIEQGNVEKVLSLLQKPATDINEVDTMRTNRPTPIQYLEKAFQSNRISKVDARTIVNAFIKKGLNTQSTSVHDFILRSDIYEPVVIEKVRNNSNRPVSITSFSMNPTPPITVQLGETELQR